MRSFSKLVTHDNSAIYKVLPIMLHKSAQEWYHILESDFIIYFYDLNFKLISCLKKNIPNKKNI